MTTTDVNFPTYKETGHFHFPIYILLCEYCIINVIYMASTLVWFTVFVLTLNCFQSFWLFLLFLFKDFAKNNKDMHGEIYMGQVADNSLSLRPPVFSVGCDLCRVCCVSASSRCIPTCCAVFTSENSFLPEVIILQSSPQKSFLLLYFVPRLMLDQFDTTFQINKKEAQFIFLWKMSLFTVSVLVWIKISLCSVAPPIRD